MNFSDDERTQFLAWREKQPWYTLSKDADKDSDEASIHRMMNMAASEAWTARAALAVPPGSLAAVRMQLLEVEAERIRQDGKWGGAEHDDGHTTADFVQLICDYAGWARVMAGMNSPDKARRRLVQVAALAIAEVERMDRAAAIAKEPTA